MDKIPQIIILSNTIIDRETGMILEREGDKVSLFVPGLTQPHLFTGQDAHDLWKHYDNRRPEWKTD